MNQTAPKVFISYKWEADAHNEWVRKFATDLRAAGIDAILDKWEVRLGESFTDYMTSKIKEADAILFIMTTRSVAAVEAPKDQGGAVKFEMQMATSRRIAAEKMRLIGVFREGNATPAHLRDHRYADFHNDLEYEIRLKELIDDLLGEDSRPPLLTRSVPEKRPTVKPTDPQELTKHYERIVSCFTQGDLVCVLGADANLCGRPAEGQVDNFPPTRDELASSLAREINYSLPDIVDLSQIAQIVANTIGSEKLFDKLQNTLEQDYAQTLLHHFFAATPGILRQKNYPLPYQLIVTTNYDDTLERSFNASGEPFDLVSFISDADDELIKGKFWHSPHEGEPAVIIDPSTYDRLPIDYHLKFERTVILKIIGGVTRHGSKHDQYIVTEDDFYKHTAQGEFIKALPTALRAILANSNLLFIGYGLDEHNMKDVFRRIWLRESFFDAWSIQWNVHKQDVDFWKGNRVLPLNVSLETYLKTLSDRIQALPRI